MRHATCTAERAAFLNTVKDLRFHKRDFFTSSINRHFNIKSEALMATESSSIFWCDQQYHHRTNISSFGDCFCLHHQGLMSPTLDDGGTNSLRNAENSFHTDKADRPSRAHCKLQYTVGWLVPVNKKKMYFQV